MPTSFIRENRKKDAQTYSNKLILIINSFAYRELSVIFITYYQSSFLN